MARMKNPQYTEPAIGWNEEDAAAAGTSYRYITICTVQYGTVLYTLDDKYVSSVSETESETQCVCVSGNQLVFLGNVGINCVS